MVPCIRVCRGISSADDIAPGALPLPFPDFPPQYQLPGLNRGNLELEKLCSQLTFQRLRHS